MSYYHEHQQQTLPPLTSTNSAGDHGMQDNYDHDDASRPTPHQAPGLTPYLGLQARLSQIWLNRWTILLLLVLVRVLLAMGSMDSDLGDARQKAMSACTKVESMGTAMASMPHYMAKGVNELTASSIDKAVNGLMSMLGLTVEAVKQIVLFVIHLLTSTYMCLITLAVGGALNAALDLVEKVTKLLDDAIGPIGDGLAKSVDGIVSGLNDAARKVEGGINTVVDGFTGIFTGGKPNNGDAVDFGKGIDVGKALEPLKNLKIPASFTEDIQKLRDNIPDFKEVQNFTDGVISIPFDKIRQLIDDKLETYSFDRSIMPVPQKEKLEFCAGDDGIDGFFDGLVDFLYQSRKIFVGVAVILAIGACVPMAVFEWKRYRRMQVFAEEAISRQRSGLKDYDAMDIVYSVTQPRTAKFGFERGKAWGGSNLQKKTLIRWTVAYATSPPALFVLSLGIAGLLSCVAQLIILKAVEAKAPELTADFADFSGKLIDTLNNASESWQNGTNLAIRNVNDDINNEVFGWVNDSTSAVNNTLNAFVDTTVEGLDKAFGGTILYDPIKGVLDCLILYKIQGIQKGLTWVSEHAQVNFPQVPPDTLSLTALANQTDSDSDDELLADPGKKVKEEMTELVAKVLDKVRSGILTEMGISGALIGVWFIVALMGLIWALICGCRPDKTRAEGGQQYPSSDPLDEEQTERSVQPVEHYGTNNGHDMTPPGYEKSQEEYRHQSEDATLNNEKSEYPAQYNTDAQNNDSRDDRMTSSTNWMSSKRGTIFPG